MTGRLCVHRRGQSFEHEQYSITVLLNAVTLYFSTPWTRIAASTFMLTASCVFLQFCFALHVFFYLINSPGEKKEKNNHRLIARIGFTTFYYGTVIK